jgi:predicted DNA binding CopG/RHH family protein
MPKKIPKFKTDEAMANFLETADLSEYDLSGFKPVSFEFAKKTAQLNMRLPAHLLEAVKTHARKRGMPYTRFIRETLERSLERATAPRAKPRAGTRGRSA